MLIKIELTQIVLAQGWWYVLYIIEMICIFPSFAFLSIFFVAIPKSFKVPKKSVISAHDCW